MALQQEQIISYQLCCENNSKQIQLFESGILGLALSYEPVFHTSHQLQKSCETAQYFPILPDID